MTVEFSIPKPDLETYRQWLKVLEREKAQVEESKSKSSAIVTHLVDVAELLRQLTSQNPLDIESALDVLLNCDCKALEQQKTIVTALTPLMIHSRHELQDRVIDLLGRFSSSALNEEVVRNLAAMIESDDLLQCDLAVELVGKFGPRLSQWASFDELTASLVRLSRSSDAYGRAFSAIAIRYLAPAMTPEFHKAIEELARDPDEQVREEAEPVLELLRAMQPINVVFSHESNKDRIVASAIYYRYRKRATEHYSYPRGHKPSSLQMLGFANAARANTPALADWNNASATVQSLRETTGHFVYTAGEVCVVLLSHRRRGFDTIELFVLQSDTHALLPRASIDWQVDDGPWRNLPGSFGTITAPIQGKLSMIVKVADRQLLKLQSCFNYRSHSDATVSGSVL
jgi:hypothetical protein